MLKLSIAIAGQDALPSAFVVFRGFEKCIPTAAKLGYEGVELALKSVSEINISVLDRLLRNAGMTVSCISTGQVFADLGYMFTDYDKNRRAILRDLFRDFIDLASVYGHHVNIGRVRGKIYKEEKDSCEGRFIDMTRDLCEYALPKGVTLILEPINRYEVNFINNVTEGAELLSEIDMPNIKLMPDLFHMNIEDITIGGEISKHIGQISYIHFADSNRLAPGWGHIDFADVFENLKKSNYTGWISVEILPYPDPYSAAKQSITFLKPFIEKYNS